MQRLIRLSGRVVIVVLAVVGAATLCSSVVKSVADDSNASREAASIKGWKKGTGWGWIWGKEDEVGALNAMTPETTRSALQLAETGRVYDLGVTYSQNSYKWPGHSPGAILTYRSPESAKKHDGAFAADPKANPLGTAWHSCALFISDNVATQIDGLAHITAGDDNHWYNGFTEDQWGGDFGVRKCDATTIPPIVARGVLLDIAGLKEVEALPPHYAIAPADVDRALAKQKVELRPGDVVLFRTGTLRYWDAEGADHERIAAHDSAGITLETARYLVEEFGTMMIGSDTSGLEVNPPPAGSKTFIPVHNYLLVEQGVHIGEFHNLEELARDGVYEFCYVAATNKIAGATAGFTLRPLAIR
ncbi:MAG: cyclase family protein [Planctomycetes bacterium]|nr:cyclase family protein [Planctomycetota bacterium]